MRSRWVIVLVFALAVGLLPSAARAAAAPARPPPASPGSPPPAAPQSPPPAVPDSPPPAAPFTVAAPSRARGATVARIVAPSFARPKVESARHGWKVDAQTAWSGQAQTLLVLAGARHDGRDWVKVLLANRPNGAAGWVLRDNVVLARSPYWIEVGLRARTVTVYRGGRRVVRTRAVVGAPATPTPRGLAAVYERNRQPDPQAFLGPWALSLTALSNVLDNYGGGPGRVAIHGRAGESFLDPLGSARSHGCIRIDNRPISWMAAHIPAGTPVDIVR